MRYATGERRRRIRPPLRSRPRAALRTGPAPRRGRAAGYREPTEAPAALRYRYV